jgi:hypothetical protein
MKRRTNRPSRSSSKRKLEGSPTLEDYNSPINAAPSAHEIIDRSVKRSGLGYEGFVKHLTQTALSRLCVWSENDLKRLLIAAERLGLDPLNNEIYAVQGGEDPMSAILLVVSVNGWARILNANPAYDGMHFLESSETQDSIPQWIECTIHRKDRNVPTTVREYLCEVKGDHGAWLTHPRRMLRHKAMVQCARICFGLVGVYDMDEALRIQEANSLLGQARNRTQPSPSSQESLKSAIRAIDNKRT